MISFNLSLQARNRGVAALQIAYLDGDPLKGPEGMNGEGEGLVLTEGGEGLEPGVEPRVAEILEVVDQARRGSGPRRSGVRLQGGNRWLLPVARGLGPWELVRGATGRWQRRDGRGGGGRPSGEADGGLPRGGARLPPLRGAP